MQKKIIIFSGAGISAESGLKTFRDSDGLWENYDLTEVATPAAWKKNPELVLDFYNLRRKQVIEAQPNKAHFSLVELEKKFNVQIITQNIDDLHERAGSSNILHLHGEILKSKSTSNEKQYNINGTDLNIGDLCVKGSQLRPDIVWFGEAVPKMIEAEELCKDADILIIIGTSLSVYPAANIVEFVPDSCINYLVDPKEIPNNGIKNLTPIKEKASIGIPILANTLLKL
ncbi:MAG: NAD-dependent protein deacylase [Flavobacteriales bacterium]|nr:MAG: NAD-dependent protein deacylase [Flavobacteriales bacterium]